MHEHTLFFNYFTSWLRDFALKLNEYEFMGVPLLYLLLSFLVTSICISVFWRGGRG